MAEYIERDALLSELQEEIDFESTMYTEEQNKWFKIGLKCAVRDVKKQPTADVVKVVRCKDCKFAKPQALKLNGKELRKCDLHKRPCFVTDFCSYGELKECKG